MAGVDISTWLHACLWVYMVQVHRWAPLVLLPVLPQLRVELEAGKEAARGRAVGLVTALLTAPQQALAQQYLDLTQVCVCCYITSYITVKRPSTRDVQRP
jgi:hypothetical protein